MFADSLYWMALSHAGDQWHSVAVQTAKALQGVGIVTTQEMLGEFLTAYRYSDRLRRLAIRRIHQIQSNTNILVIPQSDHSFRAGFVLYQARLDKQYSLADCISMETMRQEGMTEILTHDAHFTQEGFAILL